MKTLVSLFTMIALLSNTLMGQIIEKEANMSLGVQVGNEVILDDIDPKDAIDVWEDYFKDLYDEKVKRNRKADEYYSTGVRINSIFTVSKIDVYSKFEGYRDGTRMTMWVDLGMAFVNSEDYPTEYNGVVNLLEDFRVHAKTVVITNEYDEAEKNLDKMKKDLDKLEKTNSKLHDKIADYEQKIIEAENDIKQNLIEQDDKRIEIDKQIDLLKEIQIRLENIKKQAR
jgi:hypothetical protein